MSASSMGFWSETGRRLKGQRAARFGFRALLGLFVLGALAPLLAREAPLWASVEGTMRWPAFSAFSAADVVWLGALLIAVIGRLRRRLPRRVVGLAMVVIAGLTVALAVTARPVNLAVDDWDRLEREGASTVWPLCPHGTEDLDRDRILVGPTLSGGHPLGTDGLGRDVFARVLWGARTSLLVGVIAAGTASIIGLLLGAIAGWYAGRVDALVSWLIQVIMCFPVLVLVLALCTFVRPSLMWVMLLIGLTSWGIPARLVRGEVMRLRALPFVEAARALGVPEHRVLLRHVIPNALGPLIVYAALGAAAAILVESTLSFLGIGDSTVASWGALLHDGRDASPDGGHLVLAPGLMIFFTVVAWHAVGDGLRDATDVSTEGQS